MQDDSQMKSGSMLPLQATEIWATGEDCAGHPRLEIPRTLEKTRKRKASAKHSLQETIVHSHYRNNQRYNGVLSGIGRSLGRVAEDYPPRLAIFAESAEGSLVREGSNNVRSFSISWP